MEPEQVKVMYQIAQRALAQCVAAGKFPRPASDRALVLILRRGKPGACDPPARGWDWGLGEAFLDDLPIHPDAREAEATAAQIRSKCHHAVYCVCLEDDHVLHSWVAEVILPPNPTSTH